MANRPTINPAVAAEITQQAPARLRKKLDRDPNVADGWEWSVSHDQCQIDNGDQQIVLKTTDGVVQTIDSIECNCLLSPRCFHVLATITLLDVADEIASSATESQPEDEYEDREELEPLGDKQLAAVLETQRALSQMLASGARTAGSLLQANLLRAIHSCRCHGLHRLSLAETWLACAHYEQVARLAIQRERWLAR